MFRHRILPPEQEIAYQRTKGAVFKALGKSVDVALDVTREAVEISADALEFLPQIGVSVCARILLNIWNNVQNVEVCALFVSGGTVFELIGVFFVRQTDCHVWL